MNAILAAIVLVGIFACIGVVIYARFFMEPMDKWWWL
jgi:hypothetical protein